MMTTTRTAAARPVAQGAWPRATDAPARPVVCRLRVPVRTKRVVTSRGPRGVWWTAGRGGRRAVHAMANMQPSRPTSKVTAQPLLAACWVPPLAASREDAHEGFRIQLGLHERRVQIGMLHASRGTIISGHGSSQRRVC
jgi:hypothetical protein